jgi:hypothetical protein
LAYCQEDYISALTLYILAVITLALRCWLFFINPIYNLEIFICKEIIKIFKAKALRFAHLYLLPNFIDYLTFIKRLYSSLIYFNGIQIEEVQKYFIYPL